MTKPKARNTVSKLTITLGTRELYFTLAEAQLLQKMLNDTLVPHSPIVFSPSWPYSPSWPSPSYPTWWSFEVTDSPCGTSGGYTCTTTTQSGPATNTI